MTTTARHKAPDERAATANPPTPPPSSSQTCPTRIASTLILPPPGGNSSQTPPPTKLKTKTPNLEIPGTNLKPLVTVNQYSPSVPKTNQAPQHNRHTTTRSHNHNTQVAHPISNGNLLATAAPPLKQPSTITHLIDALTTDDHNIKKLIHALSEAWSSYNAHGAQVTKRQLIQCTWGVLKESDNLQEFQQAILTTIPRPTDTVTQYHTHLTSAISRDNTV
jgi:hypothetical protein